MPEEEIRYRVVELGTSGWCVNDPKRDVGLDKDQARERLNFYLNEGISPDRLLSFNINVSRFVKFPISGGIGPENEL